MSNLVTTITLPQYSTRSLSYTIARTPTYFTNLSDLVGDPTFGTLFGASSSASVFLTTAEPPVTTAGTRFLLTDSRGSNSFIDLRVDPVSFTVSSLIVLNQGLSRGLPFTLTPPSSVSGSITSTFSNVSTGVFSCSVPGSRFNVSSNSFISPSIAPLGIQITNTTSLGVVTINGTPTIPRPASNYTYFAFDSSGRQMRTDFAIQVVKPTFEYTPVTGNVAIIGSNAIATLNYGVQNTVQIDVDPTPTSFTTTGYFPFDVSLVGSRFTLSGTPTSFIDVSSGLQGVLRPSFSNIGPPLTITFQMNPVLLFEPASNLTFYCNVPYTSANPMATYSAQYYPSYVNPTYTWSLSTPITDLSLTVSTGRLYGTLSNLSNVADITVTSMNLSKTARVTLSALLDSVTVTGLSSYTAIQNTPILDLSFRASSSSGNADPLSFVYSSTPAFSTYGTPLLPDGSVRGTPRITLSEQQVTVTAINAQGIVGSTTLSFQILPDVITISQSRGLGATTSSSPLVVIQGRDITFDIPGTTRSYFATVSSGNGPIYSSDVSNGFVLSREGVLTGVPLLAGDQSFSVLTTIAYGNTFASDTLYIRAISDEVILDSPASTDFVIPLGSVSNVQLRGALFSGSAISGYSLSGNVGGAVSITSAGLLTLSSTTVQEATPFVILATAADSGVQSPIHSTLTINNPALGSFVTPSVPTIIYFSNVSDSFALQTSPSYTLTLSGGAGFTLSGSNLIRTSLSEIYTPVPAVLQATNGLAMPVQLATRSLQLRPLGPYNWIEYAQIDPIVVQTVPWSMSTYFAVPSIPPGLTWNALTGTLTGSSRELTIGSSFRIYATDGNVSTYLDVPYTSRAPAYLRGFSSPSAFTNYVKQLAIVNSAYHAIDRTAVLPEQLIASQTGEYPSDISKDVICRKEKLCGVPRSCNIQCLQP